MQFLKSKKHSLFFSTLLFITVVFVTFLFVVTINSAVEPLEYGFEDGSVGDWTSRSGETLTASTDKVHTGSYSLKVSGRVEKWGGPQISLASYAINGGTYEMSLWVYIDSDTPSAVKLTVYKGDDTGDNWRQLMQIDEPPAKEWFKLEGSYTLEYEGTLSDMHFYVESDDITYDMYIDDVTITIPDGELPEPTVAPTLAPLPINVGGIGGNPLIKTKYLADPNAMIANGKMYIYCSNDSNNLGGYDIVDYTLISSDNFVDWTDHGEIFKVPDNASWASRAYAPACVHRNGKYYLYFPNGASNIGVAVSDSPLGPFEDVLGKPLITKSMPNCNVQWCFDPAVFIDNDGQAYMYFGGGGPGNARVIKLNKDMISTSGEAVTIDAPYFFEAAFMHKYNGKYYFSYSTNWSDGHSADIDYMMSDDPMTGFEYVGTILDNPPDNLTNNNHASIVEYRGNWYISYHNRKLAKANGLKGDDQVYHRSVCLDRLYYNEDGTIQKVIPTETGPERVNIPADDNSSDSSLPKTGESSPIIYISIGLGLILLGLVLFVSKKIRFKEI